MEVNPLALLAHQTDGQLQIGIARRPSLVVGVSHLTMHGAKVDEGDTGRVLEIPTLRG